ncbi:MAG: phosphoglycerate dehydrogenase [Rhodobacteraceae bacterium]|nr:phosphoglycerate dehydrogenase [Paracoccaceae bacterium]
MQPKVLISDKLSQTAVDIFRDRGIGADFRPDLGKDPAQLAEVIHDYDGLAVRSATKVTAELLERAGKLRLVGRAGIGVDNVDITSASRRGIIVMNTPFGNAITTAEHTIAMMLSLARRIPQANESTRQGKWEKSRFTGVELAGKTLGVVGCGNIGAGVCRRARGLNMKVLGFDPFLSHEHAQNLQIEKVSYDELISRADFISFHVPLTEKTHHILDQEAIARTKKGVRIINCARGGIVDEAALVAGLQSGQIGGAAIDVFESEPPEGNPLLAIPDVVVTPHLGASTTEAQEKVAEQIAEQMSDYLLAGAVQNALNMPSISAEEAPSLKPWIALADHLGSFAGQMADEPIRSVNILFDGAVADMNVSALSAAASAGMLRVSSPEVNMVSAEILAKERGFRISTTTCPKSGIFDAFIQISIETRSRKRAIAGTVFSDRRPRFIQIADTYIDAEVRQDMLYTTNRDVPGIIGALGTILGENGVNIGSFNLGRSFKGDKAIALLSLDSPVDASVLQDIRDSGLFGQVRPLQFNTEAYRSTER